MEEASIICSSITGTDAGVDVMSNFVAIQQLDSGLGPSSLGTYFDTPVRRQGQWLFLSRRLFTTSDLAFWMRGHVVVNDPSGYLGWSDIRHPISDHIGWANYVKSPITKAL
jgi:hypothetical protein